MTNREKIVFFGNGPLAEHALKKLEQEFEIVFHARKKADLDEVCRLKKNDQSLHAVLASFGVMVPVSVLELFEPEGILNIHPSLLPLYRGASPIESAILSGDTDFSVSVMKLVKEMDAGPIYSQVTLSGAEIAKRAGVKLVSDIVPPKSAIYQVLAETGARWICDNLGNLPKPTLQDETKATYCGKMDKTMSLLTPEVDTAEQTLRKIVAYQGYPKPKYALFGQNCIILAAHALKTAENASITIKCADEALVAVDRLQPEGRKPMDAKAFLNGYSK